MIAVSKSSLDHWRYLIERPIKKEWIAHKEMVVNRFENMNITAGLVLTTTAVFVSTTPPFDPLMPYASHGSYILQLCSFVASLISLMIGTSVLIIYDTCYANDRVLKSLMNSRPRRICCLILMAYPSLALAVSTLALMTSFFIAGFTSDKLFVKIMTATTYLALLFLGALAVYVFSERIVEIASHEEENNHTTDIRDSGISQEKPGHSGSRQV